MPVSRITALDRHVAKRLKAARLQRGISQETAAKELGLSFQQVQKYENGSSRITAAKLYFLCNLYDVPIEWFFADFDNKPK